jgi:hypothetical protein
MVDAFALPTRNSLGRVLVVDDEADVRKAVNVALTWWAPPPSRVGFFNDVGLSKCVPHRSWEEGYDFWSTDQNHHSWGRYRWDGPD